MNQVAGPDDLVRKSILIEELRRAGIRNERVLTVIEAVPRPRFVPTTFVDHAWDNVALPIGLGQTISQPLVVAAMTEALELNGRETVLEIGTGSGYQTAILARLCRRVFTIERHRELSWEAEQRSKALRIGNVVYRFGDGTKGWPEAAPFDRILITAAAQTLPAVLLEQLAPDGILVAPLGAERRDQMLVRVRRQADGTTVSEELGGVRFVPLVAGLPRRSKKRTEGEATA